MDYAHLSAGGGTTDLRELALTGNGLTVFDWQDAGIVKGLTRGLLWYSGVLRLILTFEGVWFLLLKSDGTTLFDTFFCASNILINLVPDCLFSFPQNLLCIPYPSTSLFSFFMILREQILIKLIIIKILLHFLLLPIQQILWIILQQPLQRSISLLICNILPVIHPFNLMLEVPTRWWIVSGPHYVDLLSNIRIFIVRLIFIWIRYKVVSWIVFDSINIQMWVLSKVMSHSVLVYSEPFLFSNPKIRLEDVSLRSENLLDFFWNICLWFLIAVRKYILFYCEWKLIRLVLLSTVRLSGKLASESFSLLFKLFEIILVFSCAKISKAAVEEKCLLLWVHMCSVWVSVVDDIKSTVFFLAFKFLRQWWKHISSNLDLHLFHPLLLSPFFLLL